jgi:hypothetical protein
VSKIAVLRALFIGAALYDGVLGVAFLVAAPSLFARFGIPPLEHYGYVHFAAALLVVFALMFLAIARDPRGNRNLIPFGALLKVSYCSVVAFHWLAGGIADVWKPFAFVDFGFLALFLWAYRATGIVGEDARPADPAASSTRR